MSAAINAPLKAVSTSQPKLTDRQLRAIRALIDGPLMREQLDRLAACSNGPDIIVRLRKKGISINCVSVDRIDRDGKPCRPGQYSLTSDSRLVAMQLVSAA